MSAAAPTGVAAAWTDALLVQALLAVDPIGLGGISLRAPAGPVRDRWLSTLAAAQPSGSPIRRMPVHADDDRVLGGLDLAATLASGRPVARRGLLAEADGGTLILAMAERVEAGAAARLTAAMDLGCVAVPRNGLDARAPARFALILLDEGIAEDERPPPPLLDRLAFHIDLTGIGPRHIAELSSGINAPIGGLPIVMAGPDSIGDKIVRSGVTDALIRRPVNAIAGPRVQPGPGDQSSRMPRQMAGSGCARVWATNLAPMEPGPPMPAGCAAVDAARALLASVTIENAAVEALCGTAMMLGIDSLRAPFLALRVARAAAALDGRSAVAEADLILAARLVLAPRATRLPPAAETDSGPDPQTAPDANPPATSQPSDNQPDDARPDAEASSGRPLDDVVLDAARAALPPDLLARLALSGGPVRSRQSGRAGQTQSSTRRGRPIGVRPGQPKAGARLHILETLKAAAPWQKLRASSVSQFGTPRFGTPRRLEIRPADFRVVRCRQRGETTTVFAVDASGSAALHRLGEAKGAVELLLADCYVRRDQVALIAFRGRDATVLLPPTRSLVRAKRCLAGLPGGGATPLAAGIDAAAVLAGAERRRGRTPVIVLLTDGRANIARDGTGGRPRAETEALASARTPSAAGFTTLLVDTSPRPNPFAGRLAEAMRARYVPLPRADASTLSLAVRSAAAA